MGKGGMENTPFEALRKGIVSSVDRKKCTARVYFPDWDEKVSFDLPVMQKNTLNSKYYWMPEPEEQVICGFFANGTQEGIVLGAIYSEVDKVPEEFLVSDDCDGVLFSDGTLIRYDVKNHKLLIDVKGEVEVISRLVHIISDVKITENVDIGKNLDVAQAITVDHIDVNTETVGTLTAGSIVTGGG